MTNPNKLLKNFSEDVVSSLENANSDDDTIASSSEESSIDDDEIASILTEEYDKAINLFNQAISDQGPLNKILTELGMTMRSIDPAIKDLLVKIYHPEEIFFDVYVDEWPHKFPQMLNFLNQSLENKNIIFLVKTIEHIFAERDSKRRLMTHLYFSILSGELKSNSVSVTELFLLKTKNLDSFFERHYPALFKDIINDIKFKNVINSYKEIQNMYTYSYSPFNAYTNIKNTNLVFYCSLVLIALTLASLNILPMITTIVVVGSLLFITNILQNVAVHLNFKDHLKMLANTSQTTKTFRINLILTSLLTIAVTSVLVSLALYSYSTIPLLIGVFCMTLSIFANLNFCLSNYRKLSNSLIKNHKENIKQNSLQFKSLKEDFVENPSPSSTFKTSNDPNPEKPENNNLLPFNDKSLFGSTQGTGEIGKELPGNTTHFKK